MAMKTFEYKIELFSLESIPTEYYAYQKLKEYPLKSDVVYLAIPWSVLINRKEIASLDIGKIKNCDFTICQHVNYRKILPFLRKSGIRVLFAPHVNGWHANIRVLPFPHYAANGVNPACDKDILYSFIGLDSTKLIRSHLRRQIFSMPHPKDTVIAERQQWHWARESGWGDLSYERQTQERLEYKDILSRSRFSLCPRGYGASTVRFWESLQAGAIPVLISDNMELPKNFNWEKCIIRIKENKVKHILDRIGQIPDEKEKEMRLACLEAYRQFSGIQFTSVIRDYYNEAL
jgi:hypothetical protein